MVGTLHKNRVEGGGVSPVSGLDWLLPSSFSHRHARLSGLEPLWYKGLRVSTCNNRHNTKWMPNSLVTSDLSPVRGSPRGG